MLRALLCILTLLVPWSAHAQTAEEVHADFLRSVNWQIGGEQFDRTQSTGRTLITDCSSCQAIVSIQIGIYDYAYNYDTTDPNQVMRLISGACTYTDCEMRRERIAGRQGLFQAGTNFFGQHAFRRSVIIGDRLIIWEVEHGGSQRQGQALFEALGNAYLPPMLAALE